MGKVVPGDLMRTNRKIIIWLVFFTSIFGMHHCLADQKELTAPKHRSPFGQAQLAGRIEDPRLVECSGMDASSITGDLIWAVNDSGDGPFIYALGYDGRSRGRLRVAGAQNRDWEGLDTFMWQNRPMILIADFGDNQEKHAAHTLYVVAEPTYAANNIAADAVVEVAWKIVFSYPDGKHDAEGVAVDAGSGKVLVLTKRDNPPLLFELPLAPQKENLLASLVTTVPHIPAPTADDLRQKYGKYRSRPTALDISPNGDRAVVLTYKHAYLFSRSNRESWQAALSRHPIEIPLPLPQEFLDLRQREALCFMPDGKSLMVTSEGRSAGIYVLNPRPVPQSP